MLLATIIFLINIYSSAPHAKPSILEGKWRVQESIENKKQILLLYKIDTSKEETFMDRFGHFMEFNADGTYTDHASAPCGLDDNRFSYSGIWQFDNSILDLGNIKASQKRPNIYNQYTLRNTGKLKLISQKENELKFEIVKHWEKVVYRE